jgi:hypothetical protein
MGQGTFDATRNSPSRARFDAKDLDAKDPGRQESRTPSLVAASAIGGVPSLLPNGLILVAPQSGQ